MGRRQPPFFFAGLAALLRGAQEASALTVKARIAGNACLGRPVWSSDGGLVLRASPRDSG